MKNRSNKSPLTHDLTDSPGLEKIGRLLAVKSQCERDLVILIYEYHKNRQYHTDGFSTFKEAMDFLSLQSDESVNRKTLLHYNSVYSKYIKAGFALNVLNDFSILRLKKLRPFLDKLSVVEATRILQSGAAEFRNTISAFKEGALV